MTPTIECCYLLYSRYGADDLVDLTPESQKNYLSTHACTRCHNASAAWRANPVPLDIEVISLPKGPITMARGGCFAAVMRRDLAEILTPYLRKPMFGRVSAREARPKDVPGAWVTCVPGEGGGITVDRGKDGPHGVCAEGCGVIRPAVAEGSLHGGILRRDIAHHPAFFGDDRFYQIIVTDELIERLDLKSRIPDLRWQFRRYDVIDEPLDGDVLPGDPGWDGVFEGPALFLPLGTEPTIGRWTFT